MLKEVSLLDLPMDILSDIIAPLDVASLIAALSTCSVLHGTLLTRKDKLALVGN